MLKGELSQLFNFLKITLEFTLIELCCCPWRVRVAHYVLLIIEYHRRSHQGSGTGLLMIMKGRGGGRSRLAKAVTFVVIKIAGVGGSWGDGSTTF